MRPGHRLTITRWTATLVALAGAAVLGCGKPYFVDGIFTWPQKGASRAMVITPNGVQFRDSRDLPTRIIYRSPYEPWRNPVGFIAPANGRFTHTSRPTVLMTSGLVISVRPSDELVPAWGGELLLRLDLIASAAPGTVRGPMEIALVLNGSGPDTAALASAAFDQLGQNDRIMVVDAQGARIVVPWLPANHRSMAVAAVERRIDKDPQRNAAVLQLGQAVSLAWQDWNKSVVRKVVVLTDSCVGTSCRSVPRVSPSPEHSLVVSTSDADAHSIRALADAMGAKTASTGSLAERSQVVHAFVPPVGPVMARDLHIRFEGSPGPSHLLEASGGSVWWNIEADRLVLGDLHTGESRTEVVRLSVPSWTATIPFRVEVRAEFDDLQQRTRRSMQAMLEMPYDENIVRIAQTRCGDVLAYASALAWLYRLRESFLSPGTSHEGALYHLARMHQASMQALARDQGDSAALQQSISIGALLDANPP